MDVLELEDEIHSRVQNEVDKSQREFYLREQMKPDPDRTGRRRYLHARCDRTEEKGGCGQPARGSRKAGARRNWSG
ncbi:MAG: hypothetical protein M0C28_36835 [Candidatus Moduliflexus flocculans]|nr:hypothetical protein [Candidatus Moduliflexus flocculans]